jgi:hypothetical protein
MSKKDRGIILEEVIGPTQLLRGHDVHADENPSLHCGRREDFVPFMTPSFFDAILLLLHLKHLVVDNLMVWADTLKTCHDSTCFVFLSSGKLKAWRFREGRDAGAYSDGP